MPTISARLPSEEKAELDDVAELLSEDRSTTIRKALREGLEKTYDWYRKHEKEILAA